MLFRFFLASLAILAVKSLRLALRKDKRSHSRRFTLARDHKNEPAAGAVGSAAIPLGGKRQTSKLKLAGRTLSHVPQAFHGIRRP
jgi:hypothetical protein